MTTGVTKKSETAQEEKLLCPDCGCRMRRGKTHRCLSRLRSRREPQANEFTRGPEELVEWGDQDNDVNSPRATRSWGNEMGSLSDLNEMVHIPSGRRK